MSRTIKTNSGEDFFTNITEETLIGLICNEIGSPCAIHTYYDTVLVSMAYSMTKEEAKQTAHKLVEYAETLTEIPEKYQGLIKKMSLENFKTYLHNIAVDFEVSEGYYCI